MFAAFDSRCMEMTSLTILSTILQITEVRLTGRLLLGRFLVLFCIEVLNLLHSSQVAQLPRTVTS